VRFTAGFNRVYGASFVIFVAVLTIITLCGLRAVRGYQHLMDVGQPTMARIGATRIGPPSTQTRRDEYRYVLRYEVSSHASRHDYSETIAEEEVNHLPDVSHVLVTIDPANPEDHTLGIPTAAKLQERENRWATSLVLVFIGGACALAAAGLAALRERKVLRTWEFEWAEVVSCEYRHGQRNRTKVVVRIGQGASPTRTYHLFAICDLVAGDHVDVIYDPAPGSSTVRPLDDIKYVEPR
jgi:hypothetical protein